MSKTLHQGVAERSEEGRVDRSEQRLVRSGWRGAVQQAAARARRDIHGSRENSPVDPFDRELLLLAEIRRVQLAVAPIKVEDGRTSLCLRGFGRHEKEWQCFPRAVTRDGGRPTQHTPTADAASTGIGIVGRATCTSTNSRYYYYYSRQNGTALTKQVPSPPVVVGTRRTPELVLILTRSFA